MGLGVGLGLRLGVRFRLGRRWGGVGKGGWLKLEGGWGRTHFAHVS